MARTNVQLPADGSGKKLDAFSYDLGAGTVYSHPFVVCDSSGNVVDTLTSTPAGTERALAVRQVGAVALDATTLAALESITVVDGGGALSVDDNAGSLTVDAPVGTPVYTRLSDGTAAINRPYGPLRVSQDEATLFVDTHDAALDTTDKWSTATGANAPAVSSSVLAFGVATTASAFGKLSSRPTFSPIIPGFTQASFAINVGTSGGVERTNGHRFWGLGTSPATPATTSASTKLTDAVGFEIDTDGKMYAVVYANGVRTAVDLSASGTANQPLDGAYHRYLVQVRTDRIYWFIDSLGTPVASASFTVPSSQSLPILLQTINPAASVASGGYPLNVQGSVVADTASNNKQISDGVNPWRKATVHPARAAPSSASLGLMTTKLPQRQPAFQGVSAEVTPAITIGVKDLFSIWHPSTDTKDYYIVEVWVGSIITTAATGTGRSTILLQFISTIPTGGASPTAQPLLPGGTASGATLMSAKTGGGATTGQVFERKEWLYATQPLGRVSEQVWAASTLEEAIILPAGSAFGLNVSEERVAAHTSMVEVVTVRFKWYEL